MPKFRHKCKRCCFKSESLSSLRSHIRLKHADFHFDCQRAPSRSYRCHSCPFRSKLLVKCKIHHDATVKQHFNKHKCINCNFSTFSKYLILRHVRECRFKLESGSREILCDFCDRTAKRRETMERHVKIEHLHLVFACDKCPFRDKSRAEAVQHSLNNFKHDFSYRCEGCTFRTKRKRSMAAHECFKRKAKAESCSCTNCYLATRTEKFKKKFRNHFGGGKFLCGQCTFESASIECFLKHQDSHEEVEKEQINEFNAVKPCVLNEHYNFDSPKCTLEYNCRYCGYITRNFSQFRSHLDRHSLWGRYFYFEHSYATKIE